MKLSAMIRKSFVSISFASEGRIHILELNRSKSRVKNKFLADLPSGLIKEYKVVDSDKLGLILKDIWKKLKIKEKSVGIVVPEFSTYTKVLSIPKLSNKEIDEAVYWQSQDFLPDDPSGYVIDWKILSKTLKDYQILVVAIEKELLESYVDTVDKAGLLPLAVETSSLSLVRFAFQKNDENLILYIGNSQALAIVSKGQKIYGSSVMHPDSVENIIKNSKQMLGHYNDTNIKKILVGGPGLDKEIYSEIGKSFEIPVEIIGFSVRGMSEEEKQNFLIAVSMQYKNPLEPADENTINLLPEIQVKKYQTIKTKLQIWSLSLTVSLFVWISFLSVLGTYIFLAQSLNSIKNSENPNQSVIERRDALTKEIRAINSTNDKVIKIHDNWVYPQDHINLISNALPEGIVIEEYNLNFETGHISLRGTADFREDILAFKRELESSANVSDISIPISSFENDRNLIFDMSFTYSK